jgi:HSP20 family protein
MPLDGRINASSEPTQPSNGDMLWQLCRWSRFEIAASSRAPKTNMFGSLQREINSLFDDFTRSLGMYGTQGLNLVPNIDVTENEKEIEITVEMPGLERKDVEISVEGNLLTIRGEKRIEREQKNDKQKDNEKNAQLAERSYGVFYRVLQLSPGVDPSSIKATMASGMSRVMIPKPAKPQPQKIEVKEEAETVKAA